MKASVRPLVAGLLVLSGPIVFVKGTILFLAERDLDAHGIAVPAQVVGVEVEQIQKSSDRYKISLQYKTVEGKAMTDTVYVSSTKIPKPVTGQEIPILYLPSDPTKTKIAGTAMDAWLAPIVGVGMLVAGIVIYLYRSIEP